MICCEPGCPKLIPAGTGRCPVHKRERQRAYDAMRGSAQERGYDSRWRRTRAAFLRKNPNCAECGAPAVHAHHIDGRGPLGPRGHDPKNLSPLCHPCHSRLTAREQPGGWNRGVRRA